MDGAVIIADPSTKGYSFARGVYEDVATRARKDFEVQFVGLERTVFQDGEFKLKIAKNVRGQRAYIIHDPNKEASQWMADLVFSLQAATNSSPSMVSVVLPYMRFARQDRKDESRVAVNAKAVCDVMAMYAQNAMSIDLHAPQIQEYPQSTFPFDNLSSAPVLARHLEKRHGDLLENLALVSPDLSGGKRLETYEKALLKRGYKPRIALGHKRGDRSVQEVDEVVIIGKVGGRDCLIVDDIIDTGNTMVETQKSLREKGAKSVWAYGTFGLFTRGLERFREFDGLMVSDALEIGSRGKNTETISLVDLFGEAIYRSHIGESLSSLFE